MNESFSPKEALDSAIRSYNPFSNAGIVREQDIWEKGFPDIPNINGNGSEIILKALKQVQSSKSSQNKVASIVISAVPGSGKSHTLGRLRHTLEAENSGLFVYASVNNYTDLNLVTYQFQQTLAKSLSHFGSKKVTQWQEVANAMANQGIKVSNPGAGEVDFSPNFDQLAAARLAKGKNLTTSLLRNVMKLQKNQIDPYIVKAVLLTLSAANSPFAIRWLSGEDLDGNKSQELDLPNSLKTNQEREADALGKVIQIINLVSYYKPVIICFDEIDVNTNCRDDGLTTPQLIADLVKRLYDTLQQSGSGQGVVIITAMLPTTWKENLKTSPMLESKGTLDRISTFTKGKPVEFSPIKNDALIELINVWLDKFYSERNLKAPPLYPFDENQIKELGNKKPTIREALKWCAENFVVKADALPEDPKERFELALNQAAQFKIEDYLEDNQLLGKILRFGFTTLIGKILEGETPTGEKLNAISIEKIDDVQPKRKNSDYINFRLICNQKDHTLKIGVAVIQDTHGLSVGAGMLRIIDYDTFNLTKGCLVRSKTRKIRKNWDSHKYLHQLINELKGEWVDLKEDEIKPLIQLYLVDQNRDNYRLTEEQVKAFSSETTRNNNLLLEILSDPVVEIEEDDFDDFIDIDKDIRELSLEEDDFSDLFIIDDSSDLFTTKD